jgi:hypothetical protein
MPKIKEIRRSDKSNIKLSENRSEYSFFYFSSSAMGQTFASICACPTCPNAKSHSATASGGRGRCQKRTARFGEFAPTAPGHPNHFNARCSFLIVFSFGIITLGFLLSYSS